MLKAFFPFPKLVDVLRRMLNIKAVIIMMVIDLTL